MIELLYMSFANTKVRIRKLDKDHYILVDEDGNEFLKPVYTSGLIGIGQVLQEDTLDENLPAGKYNAVAYFTAVHPETNAISGKAGAKIEITVLNTVQ